MFRAFTHNASVSVKLYVSFGLILAMTALLGALAVRGANTGESQFSDYRQTARETLILGSLEEHLLLTRLGVFRFRLTESQEAVDAVNQHVADIQSELTESRTIITDPALLERVERVTASVATYRETFQDAVALQAERNTAVASMDAAGPRARANLSAIGEDAFAAGASAAAFQAGQAQEKLTLARFYAQQFLLRNAAADAERTRSELAAAQAALVQVRAGVTTGELRTRVDAVSTDLTAYAAAFNEAVGAITARNERLVNGLDKIGPQITQELGSAMNLTIERQNTVGPAAQAALAGVKQNTTVIAGIVLLVGIGLAVLLARLMSGPILAITTAMREIADDNTEIEVPGRDRKDEVGEMAAAVQVFKENAIRVRAMKAEQEALEQQAAEEKRAALAALADGFESTVLAIVDTVAAASTELESTSESLTQTADDTSRRSAAVAGAAETAASNVQSVASASEELSASAQEIASQVNQANDVSSGAAKRAEETQATVAVLSEAASRIGEVVALITDIAEQTNLLALNATIEAARAGDAGKGFAVVASEVKMLASQTAKATEEIAAQVRGMQDATDGAVSAIDAITATVADIKNITVSIASAVEEQASAVNEITRSTQEVSGSASEVTTEIDVVRQAAAETGAAAEQSLAAARELGRQSNNLKDEAVAFIQRIRAA